MISATQMRVGMIIKDGSNLLKIVTVHHTTPGNKRGIVQAKFRNLETGIQVEKRFSSKDKVEKAHLDYRDMEYLYSDQDDFHFMDTQNHDQISLSHKEAGRIDLYLTPNQNIRIVFYNEKALSVELPASVKLKIQSTVPGLRTATVTTSNKPATCETGLSVQVPQFINEGDVVRIDTSTNAYLERVKK